MTPPGRLFHQSGIVVHPPGSPEAVVSVGQSVALDITVAHEQELLLLVVELGPPSADPWEDQLEADFTLLFPGTVSLACGHVRRVFVGTLDFPNKVQSDLQGITFSAALTDLTHGDRALLLQGEAALEVRLKPVRYKKLPTVPVLAVNVITGHNVPLR